MRHLPSAAHELRQFAVLILYLIKPLIKGGSKIKKIIVALTIVISMCFSSVGEAKNKFKIATEGSLQAL